MKYAGHFTRKDAAKTGKLSIDCLREAGIQIARFDPDLMSAIEEMNRNFSSGHTYSSGHTNAVPRQRTESHPELWDKAANKIIS